MNKLTDNSVPKKQTVPVYVTGSINGAGLGDFSDTEFAEANFPKPKFASKQIYRNHIFRQQILRKKYFPIIKIMIN